MKTKRIAILVGLLLAVSSSAALGQDYEADNLDPDGNHIAFSPTGELSPGTSAPSQETMVNIIRSGTRGALIATLEYGEMVECGPCVPLLAENLLESGDSEVRRISAWWLRRRYFAINAVFTQMKGVLEGDPSEVRRSRAAEALGEFLDPNGLDPLSVAASTDTSAVVRRSSVLALGRLNHAGGHPVIAAAMEDSDAGVREAAMDVALRINFFRDVDAVIGSLDDSEGSLRRRGALLLAELGQDPGMTAEVVSAVPALAFQLASDEDRDARQAAAFALGRIGGAEAHTALVDAQASEQDSLVLDAIRVALAM